MKRKLLLAALFVVSALGFNAKAQTDVTDTYLTNAGLASLDGWAYEFFTAHDPSADVPVIEFYHTWGSNAGAAIGNSKSFYFTQKTTLPAGEYRLAVNAFYREGNGNGTNTKAYIFAGDQQKYIIGMNAGGLNGYTGGSDLLKAANAFSVGDFSNEFDFTITEETEIEIGFKGYIDTYCSWCILGPVKLYQYSMDDFNNELSAARAKLQSFDATGVNDVVKAEIDKVLAETETVTQTKAEILAATEKVNNMYNKAVAMQSALANLTAAIEEAKAVNPTTDALTNAITTAENAYNSAATVDDVNAATTTLKTTMALVVNTNAVAGASVDNPILTNFVINGTFDSGTAPWLSTTGASNQGTATNQQGAFTGNFWENWKGENYTGKMYQIIENVPNGIYELSICAFVSQYGGGTNQYVYANGAKTYLTTGVPTAYTVLAEVTNNTIEIGFEQTEAINGWSGIDNVSLTYFGSGTLDDLSALVTYNSALAAANEAAEKDMLPSIKEALEAVIAANNNVDKADLTALAAATEALNAAVVAATPSIKSYEVLANGVPNNSLDGWTCTNTNAFQVNTWSTEADNTGMVTPFIENWVGRETILGEGQFYYTMKDIAPGSYYVSALIRVYSESGSEPSGADFFVGDQTVDITTGESFEYNGMKGVYDNYSAIATVGEDGVLKFGVNIKAERTFNWVAIKDVKVMKYHTTSNLDFEASTPIDNHICTYAKDMGTNGTTYSQMQPVTGWDFGVANGDARAAGVFAYGGTPWIGGAGYPAPATNPEGVAEGNALGMVGVWTGTVQYTQKVTFEPGNYVITIPIYNSGAGKNDFVKNLIGFIAEDGTEYLASAKVYPSNTWTTETITFTLDKLTNGVLSLGYQAPNAGNGSQHHLFIDCVKIEVVTDLELAKEELLADINAAKATVEAKAGVGEGLFLIPTSALDTYAAAVAAAQGVYDNAEATADAVTAAIEALAAATEAYAATPVTAPKEGTKYIFKLNVEGDVYMNLGENVTIAEQATPISFVPAETSGQYYLVSDEYYVGLAGGNAWTMSTSVDKKAAWTFSPVGEGLYRINNTVTVGRFVGTNSSEIAAGSSVYADKRVDNGNIDWIIREATEVSVTMNISDAKYSTFIAPFGVTIPDGVTASKVTGETNGVLTLEAVETTIPANTPVVLYSETAYNSTFTGIDLSTEDSYTDGLLTGVYTATDVQLGWYVLQNNDGKVGFYRVDTEAITKVGANRCYLTIPAGSEAKAFFFGGEATGINAIEALQNGDAEIYTINGTRVNTLQKGINIVKMSNGKTQKVLVK